MVLIGDLVDFDMIINATSLGLKKKMILSMILVNSEKINFSMM